HVYPAGGTTPNTSLNFMRGTDTAIGATVDLNSSGQIAVTEAGATGAFDLVVDVAGYFSATSATGAFTPAATRIYDSRAVTPHVQLAAGATATIQVAVAQHLPTVEAGIT